MKVENMKSKDYAELGREISQGVNDYFKRKNKDNSRQKFAHLVKEARNERHD